MNSNDNHIFVNLPNLILVKIISFLKDNLDRVALILVCKKWFHLSDRILTFIIQDNVLISKNISNLKQFSMKSCLNSFERSLHLKENITYSIQSKDIDVDLDIEFDLDESDWINISNDTDLDQLEIDSSINTLKIQYLNKPLECYNNLFQDNRNITNLHISESYNNPLKIGSLPSTGQLKSIVLPDRCFVDQQAEPGILPEGLETLEFKQYCVDGILLKSGSLPQSLRHIEFHGSQIEAWLPPQLETLHCIGMSADGITINSALPMTLKDVRISADWIKRLAGLPSLTKLSISGFYRFNSISPGDIPATVTHLIFEDSPCYISRGLIPTSVRHLDLGSSIYRLMSDDGIPLFSDEYEFDYLDLGFEPPDSLPNKHLPMRIKELVYYSRVYFRPSDYKCIPNNHGIEKLSIAIPRHYSDNLSLVPHGIKELTLVNRFNNKRCLGLNEIPNSVEVVVFRDYQNVALNNDYVIPLPESVKTVHFNGYPNVVEITFNQLPETVNNITFNNGSVQLKRLDCNHFIAICIRNNLFNLGIIKTKVITSDILKFILNKR